MSGHLCEEYSIRSQVLFTNSGGRSWIMHLVQADDEDILVTTFWSRAELPDEFFDRFHSNFVACLGAEVRLHPGASKCGRCRAADVDSWKEDFGRLVSAAYGRVSPEISPVEEEEMPDMVRMEFESMLRDSEGMDRSDLS